MDNAKYCVESRTSNRLRWSSGGMFGLSLEEARKEMARLAEEYWIRQIDRDEDEAETKPKVLARIAEAEPGEEISTDFCDGWEMRVVVDD